MKRLAAVVVISVLALGVTAASGSVAAPPGHLPIAGVIPHAGTPAASQKLAAASPGDLLLQTQPCSLTDWCWVMRTNTTYAIYWMPGGGTCNGTPCSGYENGINRYFTDVAAASGSSSNVYSTDTQYYDATGPIAYSSTFGGSYVDSTTAFPASGCNDGSDAVCLTDAQLQTEIQHVISVTGWAAGMNSLFFIMTPEGVGVCFDSGSSSCTTNVFCAYHSGFSHSGVPVVYAVEPYDATNGCTQGNSPNGDDADGTINTISHEHNEAITDPWLDAWLNPDGEEMADLCAWRFGLPLGGTAGTDAYNQVINGHHYWLQEEYSNDGSTCVQQYPPAPANLSPPVVSGIAGQGQVLAATKGTWSPAPSSYEYQWQRYTDDGRGWTDISGATASTHALTTADVGHIVRVEVSAQNANGTSDFAASTATGFIVPLPTATSLPLVSGVAAVGKRLSTTRGTWNGSVAFAYGWRRCAADGTGCATISGASSSTYVATASDADHTLEAVVSATNTAGTRSASSEATAVVVAPPAAKKAPRISGRAKVGRRLSGSHGGWTESPTDYRFRWLRCSRGGAPCVPIKKATHATYRVTKRDATHRLLLRVTAVNAAGVHSATSRETPPVRGMRGR